MKQNLMNYTKLIYKNQVKFSEKIKKAGKNSPAFQLSIQCH